MVVARVYGGLGNQMFQYAAALGVAARLGTRVVVDARWFRTVGPQAGREYGLDAFGIEPGPTWPDRLRLLVSRPEVVREEEARGPEELAARRPPLVLDGYWQSERYFVRDADLVRAAFRFHDPPAPAYAPALDAVRGPHSVSIHVRRGDYVSPKRQARFGLLPIAYYERAMTLLEERLARPRFVVFSDDLDWCRDAFGGDERVSFAPAATDANAPDDLRLMAACRHHIVANSSFSWWGAWLEPHPDAIVVAPRKWYRDPSLDDSALVPPAWVRL